MCYRYKHNLIYTCSQPQPLQYVPREQIQHEAYVKEQANDQIDKTKLYKLYTIHVNSRYNMLSISERN